MVKREKLFVRLNNPFLWIGGVGRKQVDNTRRFQDRKPVLDGWHRNTQFPRIFGKIELLSATGGEELAKPLEVAQVADVVDGSDTSFKTSRSQCRIKVTL